MSLVCSILLAMHLPKTLWDELIKTITYFKNCSSGINGIIPYKLGNHIQPNLSQLKVVESCALIHIPKEKRIKLDVRSWQRIFIGYEGKNQYWVYNPRTGKVHITPDLFVDEQHLYHQEAFNDWDYSEDDWAETDNAQFANVSNFDNSGPNNSLYSVGDNTLKEPEIERNHFQVLKQDITPFDNLKSELLDLLKEEPLEINSGSIKTSRRSRQV